MTFQTILASGVLSILGGVATWLFLVYKKEQAFEAKKLADQVVKQSEAKVDSQTTDSLIASDPANRPGWQRPKT